MHEALQVTSINDDCRDEDLQTSNIAILSSRTRNLLLVEAVINKLHSITEEKYHFVVLFFSPNRY